jgi:hypothetical protein
MNFTMKYTAHPQRKTAFTKAALAIGTDSCADSQSFSLVQWHPPRAVIVLTTRSCFTRCGFVPPRSDATISSSGSMSTTISGRIRELATIHLFICIDTTMLCTLPLEC